MSILAQQYPVYQPAMRVISAITNANPAQVTTTFNHQYATNLIVRLNIPLGFGMQQANQLQGTITVNSPTTFLITIDTTLFSAFSTPANYPYSYQSATVVPVGEDNSTILQATNNALPYQAT
jgi:hypothetical protein